MKTQNTISRTATKSRLGVLFVLTVVALFTFTSCDMNTLQPLAEDLSPAALGKVVVNGEVSDLNEVVLYAGQNIPVGTLRITNDTEVLTVTYATTGGWLLAETHLHVAAGLAGIPKNKPGNPIPGQFAYNDSHYPSVTEVSYELPLEWAVGDLLVVAAHAVVERVVDGQVVQDETAWSAGSRFVAKGNWATYTVYEVEDVVTVEPPVEIWQSETAYAGNYEGGGSAWWFYYDVNGPVVQDIYAGQKPVEGAFVSLSDGNLAITLGENLKLQNVNEAVKVQGYNEIPASRLPAGQFVTYKGNDLSIAVASYPYYVIHLDVLVKQ
jgi:hypothetical protein